MTTLTSLQRDFLDRFYTEMVSAPVGHATALAGKHGFTYQHFNRLWDNYLQSWGGDTKAWGGLYPPLSPSPEPPIFPLPSLEALEAQLQEEEAKLALVNS
jgi:hypothetical protein